MISCSAIFVSISQAPICRRSSCPIRTRSGATQRLYAVRKAEALEGQATERPTSVPNIQLNTSRDSLQSLEKQVRFLVEKQTAGTPRKAETTALPSAIVAPWTRNPNTKSFSPPKTKVLLRSFFRVLHYTVRSTHFFLSVDNSLRPLSILGTEALRLSSQEA